jgi:hypothetical protein
MKRAMPPQRRRRAQSSKSCLAPPCFSFLFRVFEQNTCQAVLPTGEEPCTSRGTSAEASRPSCHRRMRPHHCLPHTRRQHHRAVVLPWGPLSRSAPIPNAQASAPHGPVRSLTPLLLPLQGHGTNLALTPRKKWSAVFCGARRVAPRRTPLVMQETRVRAEQRATKGGGTALTERSAIQGRAKAPEGSARVRHTAGTSVRLLLHMTSRDVSRSYTWSGIWRSTGGKSRGSPCGWRRVWGGS